MDDTSGIGRRIFAKFLPQPTKGEKLTEVRMDQVRTLKSTPALPNASFNFDTSVVSATLFCGTGFGGAVAIDAVNVCCVVWGGT